MRYIDADLLLEEVENNTPLNWTDSEKELQEQFDFQVFKHIIEYQPTADVVPRAIVNLILEDIFLCSEYENGKLVIDHDKIVGIKNNFQRRLKL